MRFADIIGLDETKANLIAAVQKNLIAHAQLFFGPEGSPNLALALAYASYVNCSDRSENDSCGECASCQKIDKLIHPDVQFIFPVSSTKKVTGKNVVSSSYLNEWRNFVLNSPFGNIEQWSQSYGAENKQANISKEESRNIVRTLSLKSFEAEYKVMLIWLPEYMHSSAANAILKILEEPPEKTIFLLVTNDYERLLTTIISRCQLIKIRKFTDDEIGSHLTSKMGLAEVEAQKIAGLAQGNINKAIHLIDQIEDDTNKLFRDWMRLCWARNYAELTNMNDLFNAQNKTAQLSLLIYGLNIMRAALMSKLDVRTQQGLNEEEGAFVTKFGSALSEQVLEAISLELNQGHYHLTRNANTKIMFMDMSIVIGNLMTSK